MRRVKRRWHRGGWPRGGGGLMGEIDLYEGPIRHAVDAELLEVALQAANHDRRKVVLAVDGHAACEANRVEDLEQRTKAVRVTIVGGGGEEQAIVEAGGEIADGGRDLAVDGVAAACG